MFNDQIGQVLATSGVGLGLSTAKQLTHALQGAISLQSIKGSFTKVTFSVLVKLAPEALSLTELSHQVRQLQHDSVLIVPLRHFESLRMNFGKDSSRDSSNPRVSHSVPSRQQQVQVDSPSVLRSERKMRVLNSRLKK